VQNRWQIRGLTDRKGGVIHNVLVIAEKHNFGRCLESLLLEQGYHVTTMESYDILKGLPGMNFDLVIATNTSVSPGQIKSIVPDIKTRYPKCRVLVLSGYFPKDFVANLREIGVDGFHPLPFEEFALLKDVAASWPAPAL